MSNISRNEWIIGYCKNTLADKDSLAKQYFAYMLDRTQMMFEYTNLPESIPPRELELLLQVNGSATISKVNGELYAFRGGLGGTPNAYYMPTISIVANPFLKYNATLEIDKDCVVIPNDTLYQGLTPMFNKYAYLLAESDISLKFAEVNARVPELIQADNDETKESAEEFISQIEKGEKMGIITSDNFFEGLKTLEYSSRANGNIKDMLEVQQYLKSSWYIDLGINANYNMKREAINESEATMNDDALLPLIDDMLNQRRIGLEKVNKMFDTNISVDFNSSWKKIREEIETKIEIQEKELEREEEVNLDVNQETIKGND